MKYRILCGITLLLGLLSCTFLQEIYEPRDLLLLVKIYSDIYAPNIAVLSPTNGQEVAATYQIVGNAADVGAKTDIAGIDKVYVAIDKSAFAECIVSGLTWQYVCSNLSEGWHTNYYFATDKRGNSSVTNKLIVFSQSLLPSLIISKPAYGTLTNRETIFFSGTAGIGKPYEIDSVLIENQNGLNQDQYLYLNKTKSWKGLRVLDEGTNRLRVLAVATSGKTNIINWLAILDSISPIVTIASLNGTTNQSAITFTGSFTETGSGVKNAWIKFNDGTYNPLSGITNWSFSTNLGQGSNTIRVYAIDTAHNVSATNYRAIVFDSNIPGIFINPLPTYTNVSNILVSGTASFIFGISKVYIKIGNGSYLQANGTNNWSKNVSLSSGINTLSAYCINTASTPSFTASRTIIYDNIAPEITFTKPAGNILINSNSYKVEGTSSDSGSEVKVVYMKVDGGAFKKMNGRTNWFTNLTLYSGLHTISVYAIDEGNNFSVTDSIQITDTLSGSKSITSFYQDTGVEWTLRLTNPVRWNSLASSADGSKLYAALESGSIYISHDYGVTWAAKMTDTSRQWTSIDCSSDGSKVIACARSNYLYISTDSGETWTAKKTDIVRFWNSVASSADGTKLVAVGNSTYIYTSADSGATWTERMTDITRGWYGVASSKDGVTLYACVIEGNIYKSENSGSSWSSCSTNKRWFSVNCSTNGRIVIGDTDGNCLYISTNSGTGWLQKGESRQWRTSAMSANGKCIAECPYQNSLYISTNYGLNWNTCPDITNARAAACSADWSKLAVATYDSKSIYTSSATTGIINEGAHTINVVLPIGTDLTSLVFRFATTGATVKIGATVQVSGTTANNFTSTKTYTVIAADGTTQDYTVTVSAP